MAYDQRLADAEVRIAELCGALEDAIEFAEEGWAYADPYFIEKWDAVGRAKLLKAALLNERKKPFGPAADNECPKCRQGVRHTTHYKESAEPGASR